MGNPDRPAEASGSHAATKVPDMPQRAMYQQTVPIAVEGGDGAGDLGDMPPSYEEAASGSGSGPTTVRAGSTAAGSDHGQCSQHRAEAPASRASSVDADADDALLGNSSVPGQRHRSHDQQPKPTDDAAASEIDISGYKPTDPMRWDLRERNGDWNKMDGVPGCCVSSSGGCCFSSRGGCCFSDRGGCCFSDREGCFFSDRGGCFFSDTAGCFFSSGGACCCSDHVERGPASSA